MDAIKPVDNRSEQVGDEAQTRAQSTFGKRGWRLPGKLADSYLFSQVVEATLRGLGMFVMLLLFFAVITATKKMIENSLDWRGAVQLIAYQLPRILLFTLPMSVLFGNVQAFEKLSGHGEIIALWAGGMNFKRMLRAPLIWGVTLAVLAFGVQEAVVPLAEQKRNEMLVAQITNSSTAQTDIHFRDDRPDGTTLDITAEKFIPKTRTLIRPVVQQLNAKRQFEYEIAAGRAQWNLESGLWTFYDGNIKIWDVQARAKGAVRQGGPFRVIEVEAPPPQKLHKGALTLVENLEKGNFEMVSIVELHDWRERLAARADKVDAVKLAKMVDGATFGIHDKIATPLICIALVLIGAPLGIRPQRSSAGFAMGLSLAVLLLYYVVWTWAGQLGKYGAANPYLMAYLPFMITLVAGLVLVAKKSR